VSGLCLGKGAPRSSDEASHGPSDRLLSVKQVAEHLGSDHGDGIWPVCARPACPRPDLRSNLLVKLGEVIGETHALPIVLFAPTSRCNSRCVSCDWWRSDGKTDLGLDEIRSVAEVLPRFGVRIVVFTGGKPLFRADVMEVADLFRARGLRLHLLTSGLALEQYAAGIAERFESVAVSLDGRTPTLYREIRGVDGLRAIEAGMRKLRDFAPHLAITARSTIHRHNFRHLADLVTKSQQMGFDRLSFLTADVTSESFNRAGRFPVAADPSPRLTLDATEVDEFEAIIESTLCTHAAAFASGSAIPGPGRLRSFAQYYRAHLGNGSFPPVDCNAPWTSVVIEAKGDVRPCFFHPAVGNLRKRPLADLLTVTMPSFRRGLDVATNATRQRCVCTLKVGLRTQI
jgi:MoaA/NifB/PqqE/SkfB family radical SAM enzyme